MEGIHPIELDLDDPYYEELFCGATYMENYRILIQKIRKFNENIPPLINAYMNLSPTMRVFDTVSNPDFGDVEETGILVTIRDIYRKTPALHPLAGVEANLKHRREGVQRTPARTPRTDEEKAERLSAPPVLIVISSTKWSIGPNLHRNANAGWTHLTKTTENPKTSLGMKRLFRLLAAIALLTGAWACSDDQLRRSASTAEPIFFRSTTSPAAARSPSMLRLLERHRIVRKFRGKTPTG